MKITAPGIYDISMDEYHSDICPGPSISSSGLRTIELECPLEYWAFSYLNPDRFEKDDKPAFNMGRAAHCLLLGDEDWESNYIVRPLEIAGKPWQGNRTVCKNWISEQADAGLTIVTPDELIHITGMAAMLEKHPLAKLLTEGDVEKSLIWQDEETGVWLKARPDIIPAYDSTVVDYKTTVARVRPYQLSADVIKWAYHQQMALIEEGLEILADKRGLNMVLLFQQKAPPYHVTPVEISPELLAIGRDQNRRAIRTFAKCLETGEWPGYVETGAIPVIHPPEWLVNQMERETA